MHSESDPPVLTVLLSAYNTEKYIQQAIDSILNQTFKSLELIIADDGSSDRTKKIIDSYRDERIIVSHNSKNLGKTTTINRLFKLSRGTFITIHDADDLSHPSRFKKQIEFLQQNSNFQMCGTSFITINADGKLLSRHRQPNDWKEIRKNITKVSQFHGPTILFKANIIDKIGGLFRSITMGEDIDLTMRITEKFSATNLDEYLYHYRANPNSLTKSAHHNVLNKLIDRHLIYFLAEERKFHGQDSLMTKDTKKIDQEIVRIRHQFAKNPFSAIEEYVGHLLHYNLYLNALVFIYNNWRSIPNKQKGVRLMLYVLKLKILSLK